MGILRLFLAICVILEHSNFFDIKFIGGILAVEIFFIISGFYMAMILSEKYIGVGSYFLFLKNRFLRIYPMYFVVLFIGITISILGGFLIGNWGFLNNYFIYGNNLSLLAIIGILFSNIFIIGQDWIRLLSFFPEFGNFIFFGNNSSGAISTSVFQFLPQAWTLSMELCFYIIAPFFVRRSIFFQSNILLFLILTRLILSFYFPIIDFTYLFFYQLIFFILGIYSYKIYQKHSEYFKNEIFMKILTGILLFLLLFYEILGYQEIIQMFIYILCVFVIPYLFQKTKDISFDRQLGNLSYPIYIVHLLILYITIALSKSMFFLNDALISVITIGFSVFFSILLVKFVDIPIQKIRLENFNKITFKKGK